MINRKVFALVALLSFWLFTAACTAVSEPAAVEDTAVATPITEPTPTLETVNLPTPTPPNEPTATETPQVDAKIDTFTILLQTALTNRDFELVQTTMSDAFGFGAYRSEWQQGAPADFLPQIENMLPAGVNLRFTLNPDFAAMLDGQDPQMMMGPDVTVAAVWHATGWGAEGKDEAILFVEELGDGRFVWKALLYAPGGFLPQSAELPVLDEQPAPIGLLYSKPDGGLWQVGVDGQPVELWFQEGVMPKLAPDGKHAFYQVEGDLWLLDVVTGESSQLASDSDGQETHLAGFHWWVNSSTILSGIWLDLETDGGPNLGRPALIDIVSGELTVLDSQHLMSSYPAIAANGAVAYSSVQQSANDSQTTWVYDPKSGVTAFDPSEFANAPDGFYTSPAWSADGRFLAWLVSDGIHVQLAVFDLESGMVANLPAFEGAAFGGPYPNPVFNEDPNWIALRQFTNDSAKMGLWLYTQDGQEPIFIAQNGGESLWINDHLLLFIDYDENFNGQLQQYDALTGVRSVVTLSNVAQIFSIVE